MSAAHKTNVDTVAEELMNAIDKGDSDLIHCCAWELYLRMARNQEGRVPRLFQDPEKCRKIMALLSYFAGND